MIAILTWVSIIAGGILVFLFLFSLIGGLDLDLDVGSTEVDADAGGIGLIKGFLTFISVASWVMKVLLVTNKHPALALGIGVLSGIIAFFILSYLFKLLLRNEENVNWNMSDALLAKGSVYLTIPGNEGSGIIQINVRGADRELKAKSAQKILTGEKIIVVDVDGEYAIVEQDNIQSS